MELETPRLRVRPFRPGDLEALAEILGDGRVMTFLEPPYTRQQTQAFLTWAGLGEKPLVYAIVEAATGALAGQLIWHPWEGSAWELGWILGRGFWGRGYARELTAEVLARAPELGIASVVLECHPDQGATAAIARHCGFAYQGRREGLDLWKKELLQKTDEEGELYGSDLAGSDH